MRYLLHHEDATYDTATKTYWFNLDRRISNPTRIRVNKAAYTAATAGSYPQIVYIRSHALSEMARNKHTVELKGANHENPSNVLCALQEGAILGRYTLEDARVHQFPTHKHLPVRRIDLTFTNNRTVLDGQVAAGGGGGGSSSAVTDATIAAFNDLTIWLDLDPARTLNAAFATCSVLGDLPKPLYSRSPPPAGLILTGNWDFELVLMKAGLLGISRDTNPAQGHGQALNDSSYPTSTWTEEFQVHHIWKSGSNYSQTSGLFKLNNYNCYVWPSGNGAINFRNSGGQNVALTNINWIPNRSALP